MKISFYRFSTFKRCPKIIEFWNLIPRGEREEVDSRTAVEGSVVHSIMEKHVKGQRSIGESFGYIDEELLNFESSSRIDWRGPRDREQAKKWIGQSLVHAKNIVEEFDISPKNSLSEVTLDRGVSDRVSLTGRVDVIQAKSDGVRIFDWKATRRDGSFDKDQMLTYFYLVGSLASNIKEGYFILTHFGKFERVVFSEQEVDDLVFRMTQAADRMEAGDLPAVAGSHCSWCEFKSFCDRYQHWKSNDGLEINNIWMF